MEGVIFDIKRFAIHDGPGIRTTVFFKGCPLNCQWCHNPESICREPEAHKKTVQLNGRTHIITEEIGYNISSNTLLQEIEKERIFMEESNGGITFSGGEPLLQGEFLEDCLMKAKKANLHTTLDTSLLANWQIIEEISQFTDLYLVDLKLIEDSLHQKFTGVSNVKILRNLLGLSQLSDQIRIRIPIIPEVNNTKQNINDTILFLSKIKSSILGVDLLPFHNSASSKYDRFKRTNTFSNKPSMQKDDVNWIKNEFETAGYETSIGG